jgi:acetyltransferase-like isoleucine patch superfamily enzyme
MTSSSISHSARIADDVEIGEFCVIGEDVEIGRGARIGHHVVIHAGSRIGGDVRIDDHAVVGKQPMRARRSALSGSEQQPPAEIGEQAILGTGAIVYAGARIGDGVLVADLATVREDVTIGNNTIIGRGAAVENHSSIGSRCKLETNAYITAYSTVEDDVFVAPGVLTSNDRFIGRTKERLGQFKGVHARKGARLGVGAIVLPGIELAEESVAAAGAVVTRPTEEATIHAGVPARRFTEVPEEQLLISNT